MIYFVPICLQSNKWTYFKYRNPYNRRDKRYSVRPCWHKFPEMLKVFKFDSHKFFVKGTSWTFINNIIVTTRQSLCMKMFLKSFNFGWFIEFILICAKPVLSLFMKLTCSPATRLIGLYFSLSWHVIRHFAFYTLLHHDRRLTPLYRERR